MAKVTYKVVHTPDAYKRSVTDMVLDVPCDDMEGIMEFLEIMNEENFEEGLEWKVRCGVVSAGDNEGWFYCIVPEVK